MADSTPRDDRQAYPPLLSLAVHECRTPAGVVAGYLRLLMRDGGEPLTDQQRKMIQEADKACARIVTILAELSDIGKLDGGSVALTRQPIDVFALAGEVAASVHEGIDREVHLTLRGEAGAARSMGDAIRLRAAFGAVYRAILREKPGPCTVNVERRRMARDGIQCAVIVVADEADVQNVYDGPPARFDDQRGGLGLALPLARRVIEGHGGQLWSPAPAGEEARARGSAGIAIPLVECAS